MMGIINSRLIASRGLISVTAASSQTVTTPSIAIRITDASAQRRPSISCRMTA